ncbi:hypothetical protein F7725_016356 [Dissostichus mawsoni]|uniref:Uncharacterized protein n=1 Tax=Dissostichus mawsoni TaxID=36200 RepID=A0A7J5Z2B7_DISMA|nr:hypothetical protein F7725_016356 [Dissostichus mawsoni]
MMCTDTWATKEGDHPLYPPPPAYVPQPELNKNTLVPEVKVPTVSEDVAREALLKFVESKWRYSSKTGQEHGLQTAQTHHRQVVDGPQYGASPPPWDIPLMLPQRYSDRVEKTRVPHSSCVTSVTAVEEPAVSAAMEEDRCISCHGMGYKTCSVCQGSQNMLHSIQLTVTWKNNISNFIPDRQPDFPDKNFENVSGDPFFIDESNLVYPIQGFPDQEICDVSTKMINEHYGRFSSTSRILQHTIELVPLTHAIYTYSGKDFSFFVYGVENQVFAAKYPSACSIL